MTGLNCSSSSLGCQKGKRKNEKMKLQARPAFLESVLGFLFVFKEGFYLFFIFFKKGRSHGI